VTQFDPGLLRQRVEVERPVGTPDEAGGETVAWETVATLWARIDPVKAGEHTIAGHLAALVSHKLTFRWREDLAGGMRVLFRERRFRILAVFDPDERRHYVVAVAEEEKP
jgi:SPP1 family predicted phage head-tail adaptor